MSMFDGIKYLLNAKKLLEEDDDEDIENPKPNSMGLRCLVKDGVATITITHNLSSPESSMVAIYVHDAIALALRSCAHESNIYNVCTTINEKRFDNLDIETGEDLKKNCARSLEQISAGVLKMNHHLIDGFNKATEIMADLKKKVKRNG